MRNTIFRDGNSRSMNVALALVSAMFLSTYPCLSIMKKIAIAVALAAGGLSLSGGASAQTAPAAGTLTFSGSLMSETCAINAGDTGGANATITMPGVLTSALTAAGERAGKTPFTIKVGTDLKQCEARRVQIQFLADGTNVNKDGRLNNTGGAGNVDIALLNAKGDDIDLNTNDGSETVIVSDGKAQIDFSSQYYATAATTAGSVDAQIEYAVVYP